MKKRILSLLLAVCLCLTLLPTVALAADGWGISIYGNDLSSITTLPDGVSLSDDHKTLTLDGAVLTPDQECFTTSVISTNSRDFTDTLTIDLRGENSITVTSGVEIGIFAQTDVHIISSSGDGTLTINFESGTRTESAGIKIAMSREERASLTIDPGVTVTVTGGNVENSSGAAASYGVYVSCNLTVNGTLNATGGSATSQTDGAISYGVYAGGDVSVNGTLNATGGKAVSNRNDSSAELFARSAGLYSKGNVTVSGAAATLTARSLGPQGGAAAQSVSVGSESYGLRFEGNKTFKICGGATVTAEAGKAECSRTSSYSEGLFTDGPILVADSGSKLTATGGTAKARSMGILQSQQASMTINGGEVTATGGEVTSSGLSAGISIQGEVDGQALTLNGGSLIAAGGTRGLYYATASVNINAGTARLCGGRSGIMGYSPVSIGAAGKHVDFTAQATSTTDPNAAALQLRKRIVHASGDTKVEEKGDLILSHVQIAAPTDGTKGEFVIDYSSRQETFVTVLDAAGKAAMEVQIVSTTETDTTDENLPCWLPPVLGAVNAPTFTDVKTGDWFYDDVCYVSECGLMTGTGENLFSPNAPVTRGMVMTILARREGIKTDRYSPWYAAGVEWAVENGISDGTNPEEPITREQLAVMLYRYAVYAGLASTADADGDLLDFPDAQSISGYALDGMSWTVTAGLMNGAAGLDAGKLLPQAEATRAQLAAMLHRFFG